MKQITLKNKIEINGIGLHSGCKSDLVLTPAPANSGISFRRTDVLNAPTVAGLYSEVVDTRNCTCLGKNGLNISTIEHLMAALYASGIDNVMIECSNQEMPIMDGSAEMFLNILQRAEKTEQDFPRRYLKVLRPVRFEDDKGNWVELTPNDGKNLFVRFDIEFPSKIVGHQTFNNEITEKTFQELIAPCRTFCEKQQIDYLQSIGLIKGGSLENAVVLDGENILNPGGFRVENECVNHKVLDLVGDLFTSGFRILANVNAWRTGHYHNNALLKKLFADENNFEIVENR